MSQTDSLKSQVDVLQAKLLIARHRAVAEEEELSRIEAGRETVLRVQQIVQQISQELQTQAHQQIAGVVSRCLETVFPDEPYKFFIQFEMKRGKTEAVLTFERDGVVLDDPLNEVGGGVIDVASFALRLACLLLSRPRLDRVLVLDEPFSNIRGDGNRARTRELLTTLSKELGLQIIINTDIPEYRLGTVVEMSG
jgi:hypothetical protein